MKKTLLVLATLSLTSAAMADVTISGVLDAGYVSTNNWSRDISKDVINAPAGTPGDIIGTTPIASSGFGVAKSQIFITANQKIDANQEIIAKMGIGGLDRSMETDPSYDNNPANRMGITGTSVTGLNASLAYINQHFGQIKMGNTTDQNFFVGIASANSPTIAFDNKLFQQRSANDYISYTVPIGPVYFVATRNEANAGLGIGKGEIGGATLSPNAQANNQFTALYKNDNLVAALTYQNYNDRKGGTGTTSMAGFDVYNTVLGTKNDVWNFQTSYDLGYAKFGYGVQLANATNGTKILDSLVGMTVPAGAWTLGATFGIENGWGVPKTTTLGTGLASVVNWDISKYQMTTTGYSLGAAYNFSKNTQLTLKYAAWNASGYNQYQNDANALAQYAGSGNVTAILNYLNSHKTLYGIGGLGQGLATQTAIDLVHTF